MYELQETLRVDTPWGRVWVTHQVAVLGQQLMGCSWVQNVPS